MQASSTGLDEEFVALLTKLSKRNPGALNVCLQLISHLGELSAFDFLLLEEMDILGEEMWYLYKACEKNIDQFHASLMQKTALHKLQSFPHSKYFRVEER